MTAARKTVITLIHVGCKELGLDADTRHDLQLMTTGKASLTDMTEAEMLAVVEALKARGFRPSGGSKARRAPAKRGDVRFAHVLFGKLHRAGRVGVGGAEGLNLFIRVRFGAAWGAVPIDIDRMTDAAQIATVIEALKAMCLRAGIKV